MSQPFSHFFYRQSRQRFVSGFIALAFLISATPAGATAAQTSPEQTTSEKSDSGKTTSVKSVSEKSDYEKKCRAFISSKGKKNDSQRLKEMFDLQWTHWMTTYPEWATYVGYPGQNARWTDNSFEAIAQRDRDLKWPLEMAKSINRSKLKPAERLNYDLFRERAELALEGSRFRGEYLQVNQLGGIQQDFAQMFIVMPNVTEKDYADILARLKGAGKVIDQSLALLRKGFEEKVTAPKITLRDVPGQFDAMIKDQPMESPILLPFKEIPASIPKERATAMRAEAEKIYAEEIRPRLVAYRKYLVETYIPGARESVSWKDLPNGEAWYAFKARETTTLTLSPKEIHEIGMSEVKRIRIEMEKVKQEAGFKGDLNAFMKFLRSDKRFFFSSPEELLTEYRAIGKRADPELVKVFGRLPRLPYGILPVPAYSEKSQPTAYYQGGSLQTGRPGYFYANTYDLKSRPKWEMEALTLHEAVPGHHFQIALAQEMEEGPEFRKHDGYTAYVEGWGLYAESLGYEMGFYKDPYSKFGQLTFEMWRALRLVVDTGIHHLGWSRQQAIDFMKANVAKPEHDIIVEVDRYIVWAGQALAYKMGQMKIKDLRERATRELGANFNVRKFHDLVLGQGALPLGVLDRIVTEWIQTEKKAAIKL